MPKQIATEVLAVLARCGMEDDKLTLPSQLDRKMYTAVNKIIEQAGGVWSRKAKAHVFADSSAEDAMEKIILTGQITDEKAEFNYFYTPVTVVRRMLKAANIQEGMTILEPEAGQGHLLGSLPGGNLAYCVELQDKFVAKLKSHYSGSILAGEVTIIQGDFLNIPPQIDYPRGAACIPMVDRVVMNPPFSKGRDIAHVTHALRFLKPGGRLVAIMSAAVTFRTDRRTEAFLNHIKTLTAATGGYAFDPLPEGSFKEAGTMVNTVMLTVQV